MLLTMLLTSTGRRTMATATADIDGIVGAVVVVVVVVAVFVVVVVAIALSQNVVTQMVVAIALK